MESTREHFDSFVAKIADYSAEHKLLPSQGGRVLAAVSGGGDSIALLTVLMELASRYGFSVVAAHLNHNLRDRESDSDEVFVAEYCRTHGIELIAKKLPAGSLNTSGKSLETAARDARIMFLEEAVIQCGADRIASGHSMDDQVETVLQRLLRGTGPAGLAGILPMRDSLWIRPLLSSGRQEIRDFLDNANIEYRNDSSNNDTSFFRNSLRLELLPLISERYSPAFRDGIMRLSELSRQQEDFLGNIVENSFNDCVIVANPFKILLDKSMFEDYHNVVKQRIVMIDGCGRDTDMREIETVLDMFNTDRAEIDLSGSVRFGVEKSIAAFIREKQHDAPSKLTIEGRTTLPTGCGTVEVTKTAHAVKVDGIESVIVPESIIDTHGNLSAGTAAAGERITPFGMNEPVKIRDIIAQHVPKILRNHIPVVRAGAVPIWIPGIRSSEILRMREPQLTGKMSGGAVYRLKLTGGITRSMFR